MGCCSAPLYVRPNDLLTPQKVVAEYDKTTLASTKPTNTLRDAAVIQRLFSCCKVLEQVEH